MTKPLAKKKTVTKPVVKKTTVKTVKTVEAKKPEKVVYPVDSSEGREHEHF
jgi:hypothetical protein